MPDITLAEFAANFDRAAHQPRLLEAERQRRTIVDQFPREELRTLEMTRYADDREDRSTLAWLLTKGTPALGDIPGVAFNATGIYKLKGSGLYRSTLSANEDAAEDWQKLREGLAKCCELALSQQWEAIDKVAYANSVRALRTKLLYVYFPNEVLPLHAPAEVDYFFAVLGIDKTLGESKSAASRNRVLLEYLRSLPDLANWSPLELANLLAAYSSKVELPQAKLTNMERIIKAMIEMRLANPSTNEWISPDAVAQHVLDSQGHVIGDPPTEMSDMLTKEHQRPGRKPVKSPRWWVLEEDRAKRLFRLSDEAWNLWHLRLAPLNKFQSATLPSMPAQALNQILYGPPGTGKTYRVIREAAAIIAGQPILNDQEAKNVYDSGCNEGRVRLATFHQSFGYEDFIEGIRPVMDESGEAKFQVRDGVFKEIAVEALFACLELAGSSSPGDSQYQRPSAGTKTGQVWEIADALTTEFGRTPTRSEIMQRAIEAGTNKNTAGTQASRWRISQGFKEDDLSAAEVVQSFLTDGTASGWRLRADKNYPPYVLVVDEINRGNISRIFGELITLIEDDKREGRANSLRVTLPSSRELFTVPPNLFLLGTMNTADKSLALLDVALRRRFDFRELGPDFSVCGLPEDMCTVLERLNERIELRKDRDHRIGHAFFMSVRDEEGFNRAFVRKVVPLLQEYFYNDIDGARFVLGEIGREGEAGFLRQITSTPSEAKYQRNRWRWFTDVEPGMNCWTRLWATLGADFS